MEKYVLPIFLSTFQPTKVSPLTVDYNLQQKWYSLNKIAYLTQNFGAERAKILMHEVLEGIYPSPFDNLSYFECLSRLHPVALSLAIGRQGCIWHFYKEEPWFFPSILSNSASSLFSLGNNPVSSDFHATGLNKHVLEITRDLTWQYLRFIAIYLNKFFCFLNDLNTFSSGSGEIDFKEIIQLYSAVKLIFADIASINLSTQGHLRFSHVFSALDKMANLRSRALKINSGIIRKDSELWPELLSTAQACSLADSVEKATTALGYNKLSNVLTGFIHDTYKEVHSHIINQMDYGHCRNESDRLKYLRSHRNLRHGSFLDRNQFDNIFLLGSGTLPGSLAAIPLVLMLGFVCNPEEFLQFQLSS